MPTNGLVEPSPAWSFGFRALYRALRWVDPLLRLWWQGYGLGNVVDVAIVGRHTGKPRHTLLGLLQADGRWYLGHPNGPTEWTHNLDAAGGRLQVSWSESTVVAFWARPLPLGPERDRAILATGQHPFPGNLIYRLARQHVRAAGRYYRLELDPGE